MEGLINIEKDLTINFVRDTMVEKKGFGDVRSLPDGYGK